MSNADAQPPKIPDHDLLRCVGRGSYGEVWLARSVIGGFRAVKIVHRASFDSDRPYEREFGGLKKFEPVSRMHPGVVNILHVGQNLGGGYFYCIMEAADDLGLGQQIDPEKYQPRTLASELAKRGRLPAEECAELGFALTNALGHLHSHGLVHRDIKPSNIIFINGAPKLADIGLVTHIGTKATFVGTEGYIPPEGPGSPSADLYSLGKVLYEIAMGKSPDQFPELPTRLRELPEAPSLMRLNAIVLKACEPQPAKRFRSAEEMSAALAELKSFAGKTASAHRAEHQGPRLSVVILCAGASSADKTLLERLSVRLADAGMVIEGEPQPVLGLEWARRVEQQIRAADAVIPILSAASIHSEIMAYGLEVAQQAARRSNHLPRLVPLSIGLTNSLPLQIGLALDGAPVISIDPETAADGIEKVIAALQIAAPS